MDKNNFRKKMTIIIKIIMIVIVGKYRIMINLKFKNDIWDKNYELIKN